MRVGSRASDIRMHEHNRRADLSIKVVMLQLGQIHLSLRVNCSSMSPTHPFGQPNTLVGIDMRLQFLLTSQVT